MDTHRLTPIHDNLSYIETTLFLADRNNKLQYNYVYDSTGRLISSTRTKTDTNTRVAMFEYDFDLNNNMTKFVALTPYGSNVTQYTYGADNLPELSTFSNGKKLAYVFDTVCLPKLVEINTTTPIKTEYTYFRVDGSSFDKLTDVVRTEKSGAFNYRYKYNKNYSITEILETVTDENNVSTESVIENYTYDALDQLTQAVDYKHNKKYVYTYNGGNITEEKIYDISGSSEVLSKTNTYSYDDASWGDLLTAYNGQAITYDEIGNPLKYRDDIDLTWSNGRQLSSYTKGDTTVEYTYDTDGMRLTKKIGNTNYTYLYNEGLLVQETRGNEIFDYSYDANGCIRMLKHRATESATPTYYYYALNSRNDVVGLYDANGAVCAKYTYDPWGNKTSVTDADGTAITDENDIAHTQPFRYRSYYYDTDSGFYYLQSRYYDPVTHRFINVDNVVAGIGESVKGYNLFTYCMNNPVNQSDSDGNWPKWAKKLVVAATVVAVVAVVAAVTVATAGAGTAIAAIAVGAAKGAAIGLAVGAATGAAIGYASTRTRDGTLNGMADGALSGAISGAITGGVNGYSNYSSAANYLRSNGANPKEVLSSYKGTPKVQTLKMDTTVYRTWGGTTKELGHWVSPNNYGSSARSLLSLPSSNTMTNTSSFLLQKGTTVLTGKAAPLFGQTGGGVQWWISVLG